jgi:outer membrane murein-binding lipoprotein Lpp
VTEQAKLSEVEGLGSEVEGLGSEVEGLGSKVEAPDSEVEAPDSEVEAPAVAPVSNIWPRTGVAHVPRGDLVYWYVD